MTSRHRRWRALLPLGIAAAFAAACDRTYRYEIPIDHEALKLSPLVDPLPVTMGVFYDPAFAQYRSESSNNLAGLEAVFFYEAEVGAASIVLFDHLTGAMFREMRRLETRPTEDAPAAGVAAFLTASVLNSWAAPAWSVPSFHASVAYRIALHAPDGTLLATWEPYGAGARSAEMFNPFWTGRLGLALADAMRAAGARFALACDTDEAVRRCLGGEGPPGPPGETLQQCFHAPSR